MGLGSFEPADFGGQFAEKFMGACILRLEFGEFFERLLCLSRKSYGSLATGKILPNLGSVRSFFDGSNKVRFRLRMAA